VLQSVFDAAIEAVSPNSRELILEEYLDAHLGRLSAACISTSHGLPVEGGVSACFKSCHKAFKRAVLAMGAEGKDGFRSRYLQWVEGVVLSPEFQLQQAERTARKAGKGSKRQRSGEVVLGEKGTTSDESLASARLAMVRMVVDWLLSEPGPSSELYRLCIATERTVERSAVVAEPASNGKTAAATRATLLFEAGASAHGEDTELWLMYIRHELLSGSFAHAASLHRRAVKALPDAAQATFVAAYQVLIQSSG
jgi:hypothetical protein